MRGFRESISSKRVTVVGAGVSGLSAIRLLLRLGCGKIFVSDKNFPASVNLEFFSSHGIDFEIGHSARIFNSDLVILSPGVKIGQYPFYSLKDLAIPFMGELELGYRFTSGRFIAVTGTNGKSTVVTLISKMLDGAIPAGNIGSPLTEYAFKEGTFVLEVSSFQLMTIVDFKPDISVITNIDQDHLDWHSSMEEYVRAKYRIFENQGRDDFLILNYDDELTRRAADIAQSQVLFFSLKEKLNAYVDGGILTVSLPDGRKFEIVKARELLVVGEHNIQNALAASLAAILAGASPERVREVLKNFRGLPHRIEFVGEFSGVRVYNDSKATNPHAVRGSLSAFDRNVILILGGEEKFLDYTPLIPHIKEKVKAIVVFGKNSPTLEQVFKGVSRLLKAKNLKEVVELSFEVAEPGDVILFAPGTSSFDMFRNYKERGERFKDEVKRFIRR